MLLYRTEKKRIDAMSEYLCRATLKEREKAFAEKLNQKDKTKIYHHGFKNVDSHVFIKCLICGSVYEIAASIVRSKKNNIYCEKCSEQNKALRQKELEAERKKNKERQDRLRQLNKYLANSKQLTFNVCPHCGKLFVGTNKYCSKKCRERNHEQRKTRLRIDRAKENGKADYAITLDKLITRDKNICYICNKECNESDYTYQGKTFIAGDYYPSIDHVIPIAKGGTHTWNNVKLAHRICNSIKGDRV
jgi:5-methylcytosine-specific restriction endonuclease McrA